MTTEIAKATPTGLATRPDWITEGTQGKENIGKNDIRFPAIKLAQSMTPQAKRSDPKYIDGLREGDLFNTVTKEVYGDTAISFLVINYLGRRNMEFDPNDRTVVIDGNVADTDPRCGFTVGPDPENPGQTKKFKPRATTFKDFVILLLRDGLDPEIVTLTVKGTQLKKVTDMLTLFSTSKFPSYAYLVQATPKPEKWKKGDGYGWFFDVKGWSPANAYKLAEAAFQKFQGKEVEIERHDDVVEEADPTVPADDDTPF